LSPSQKLRIWLLVTSKRHGNRIRGYIIMSGVTLILYLIIQSVPILLIVLGWIHTVTYVYRVSNRNRYNNISTK